MKEFTQLPLCGKFSLSISTWAHPSRPSANEDLHSTKVPCSHCYGENRSWDEEVWATRMGQLGGARGRTQFCKDFHPVPSLCTGFDVATMTGYILDNKATHTVLWLVRTVTSNHLATMSREEDWKPFQGKGLGEKWDKMAATAHAQ